MFDSPLKVVEVTGATAPADCGEDYTPTRPGELSPSAEESFLSLWDADRYREAATLALSVALSSDEADRFVYTGRYGACCWKMSEHGAALAAMEAADTLRKSAPSTRDLARHHTNYGLALWSKHRLNEAAYHTNEARKAYEALDLKDRVASAYNNLGLIYGDLKRTAEAIAYIALSESIYEELGDKEMLLEVADSRMKVRAAALSTGEAGRG